MKKSQKMQQTQQTQKANKTTQGKPKSQQNMMNFWLSVCKENLRPLNPANKINCIFVHIMQKLSKSKQTAVVTATQTRGFSLDLIPTGKFVTVEFVNKHGALSRHNGRTGVKKYLKHVQFSNAQKGDYFVLWVRRGGIKFDSVAMIHKNRIVRLVAGGVVLYENQASRYSRTV